jgi:glutathione peroxidase
VLGEAGAPRWNFHKYLIGSDGQLAGTWPSQVRPTDSVITKEIDNALPKP